MIALSFERWSHSAGRWFVWDRIYRHGYKWTPFCKLRLRHALRPSHVIIRRNDRN